MCLIAGRQRGRGTWQESKGTWGTGGIAGRRAGEEQRKSYSSRKEPPSCTDELKPLMACALTQAELLHLDCLSQFIPVSQACK